MINCGFKTSEPLQPKCIHFSWCGKIVMKYSIFPSRVHHMFPFNTSSVYRTYTVATDSSLWWVNSALALEWKVWGLWVTKNKSITLKSWSLSLPKPIFIWHKHQKQLQVKGCIATNIWDKLIYKIAWLLSEIQIVIIYLFGMFSITDQI